MHSSRHRIYTVASLSIVLSLVGLWFTMRLSAQQSGTVETLSPVANVTYLTADEVEIGGYLALPPDLDPAASPDDAEETETRYPAVLMVHEWWGLNEEIVAMADILAAEGYIVLAADTYRGLSADTVPGALALRLTADEERANDDMQAAFDYLLTLDAVDPARIGVIGFCYGGGVALRFAVANSALAATINLYGDTIDDPEGFGGLLESGAPLLGIFGEVDNQIPLSEVEAFTAALEAANIPHEITVYEGMGHAFVDAESIQQPGAPQDAWTQILAFLAETLQDEEIG